MVTGFIDHAHQARLHQEIYSAVIKGLLTGGKERGFAVKRAEITPNYLSNLLNPDHDPPSPAVAHRIVSALPLDSDQRSRLLEHMLLARQHRSQISESLHAHWSSLCVVKPSGTL